MRMLKIGDIHSKRGGRKTQRLLREKIKSKIEQEKPDAIAVLGDMGEDHALMYLEPWQEIIQWFLYLDSLDVPVFYILGNHDAENNQIFLTDDHFFNVFKTFKNIEVVDTVKTLEFDGTKITMCPYVPPGRFLEAVGADIAKHKPASVLAHQEFIGAKMGGIVSTIGDIYPADFPVVYSGHIHPESSPQPNIHYIGTPYHTNYGDSGAKSIAIVCYSDNKIVEDRRVPTGMPKKISHRVNVTGFKDLEFNPGNEYRVTVLDKKEELVKLKKTKKFTEMSKMAMVILKPTDNKVTEKNSENLSYSNLLKKSLQAESDPVRKFMSEVVADVTEIDKLQTAQELRA